MLEVCVDSLESAINAIHGGADELEVCSSLTEGGLTPSAGLVKLIREMVNNLSCKRPIHESCGDCNCVNLRVPKLNVMIRCRTGSDFHYSKEEMSTMLADIEVFHFIGVDRFVFGALTDTQDIHINNCNQIKQCALSIPLTFHRAFDMCKDPQKSIEKVIMLGFDRVLTSGQKSSADHSEGFQLINTLNKSYGHKIVVMPGAGINLNNARSFIDIGCKIVHSSCKLIRHLPQIGQGLNMGTNDSENVFVTDENIVRKIKECIVG